MKLLTTPIKLETEFRRLIKNYGQFYWATAWAGESQLFNELVLHKTKIKKIAVGIHFYQTHPNFIKEFLNDSRVRFIQQPSGTFHPKLYLFIDTSDKWELLVGSANFTNKAFSKNTEATVLLTSKDSNSKDILKNAMSLVEDSWKQAEIYDEEELKKYSITWKNLRPKINSLSGQYGSRKKEPKPIHEVQVINKSWREFINEVQSETSHGLDKRLKVIKIAKQLFEKTNHFNELKEDERKFIAGYPNKLDIDGAVDWGSFGSMKGRGDFAHEIIANNIFISNALDQIPLTGQITKFHYDKFIKYFKKAFIGNYIGTATRLLSMKRPDIFICFNNKNKSALCRDFGIIQKGLDYERYWEDIIERIYDSDWWLNTDPKNEIETKVSEARAAFLDSLYYKK